MTITEIEKVLKEQEKNDILKAISEIILDKIKGNAIAQENIAIAIKDGKTLAGAYKKLEEYARKHKSGSCGIVPPDKAEKIICEYFEVPLKPISIPTAEDEPLSLLDMI